MTLIARARLKVLGAVLSATLFILPFKIAAGEDQGAGAALGLMAFVFVLFLPWAAQRLPAISRERRRATISLSWKLAIAAGLGNLAQGYALESLHAGVAVTFIQMNVLFVAILAFLWLREPLTLPALIGVSLALGGIVATQWPAFSGHFDWSFGVLWAVGSAFCFSMMDLLARREIKNADPMIANVIRALLGAFLLAMVPGALEQLAAMSLKQVVACALAAVAGPGIARLLLISAARDLPAVESALIQQLRPLLALPLTSVVFGIWPTQWEWAGAALLTSGVVLPFAAQWRTRRVAVSSG